MRTFVTATALLLFSGLADAQDSQPASAPTSAPTKDIAVKSFLPWTPGTEIHYTGESAVSYHSEEGDQELSITHQGRLIVLAQEKDGRLRVAWIVRSETDGAPDADVSARQILFDPATGVSEEVKVQIEGVDALSLMIPDGGLEAPLFALPLDAVSVAKAWTEKRPIASALTRSSVPQALKTERSEKDGKAVVTFTSTIAEKMPYTLKMTLPDGIEAPEGAFADLPDLTIEDYKTVFTIEAESGRVLGSTRLSTVSVGEEMTVSDRTEVKETARKVVEAKGIAEIDEAVTVLAKARKLIFSDAARTKALLKDFDKRFPTSGLYEAAELLIGTVEMLEDMAEMEGHDDPEVADEPALPEDPTEAADPLIGKPAPDFALKDLDGKEVKLSSLKGKVVALVFWGVACGNCRAEAPHLSSLYDELKDKGFTVLAVNGYDESSEKVKKFVAEKKLSYPIAMMGGKVAKSTYGVSGFPTAYFLDRDGVIRDRVTGFAAGAEKHLKIVIEKLLAAPGGEKKEAKKEKNP